MNDIHWMREALKEAEKAFHLGEVPIGAVLVANERIIARGHNLVERLHDATAHAEMLTLCSGMEFFNSKYLPLCTLYVTIEPCVMCIGATRWAQIKRIVYGAEDPKGGFQTLAPTAPHPACEVTGGVLAHEAAALMQQFFKARRK